MARLSRDQVVGYARAAGFNGNGLDVIVAIAEAESGFVTNARNSVGNSAGIDRGILQINSYYHAEVSDAECDDPAAAFRHGYRIASRGTNFTPWSTYTNGAYRRFLQNTETPRSFGPEAARRAMVASYTWFSGWGEPRAGARYHEGEDLGAPSGTPVRAPEAGTVTNNYYDERGGNAVYMAADSGRHWYFAHFRSRSPVPIGARVKVGDTVGLVGQTGDAISTPPHLHYQVKRSGNAPWEDPRMVLQNYGGQDTTPPDEPPTRPGNRPTSITLYHLPNYEGRERSFTTDLTGVPVGWIFGWINGDPDMPDDLAVRSIKIEPAGTCIIVYPNSNFDESYNESGQNGTKRTFCQSIPNTEGRVWSHPWGPPRIGSIQFGSKIGMGGSYNVSGGSKLAGAVHQTLVAFPGFYGIALAVDQAMQFPGLISYGNMPGDIVRAAGATVIENTQAAMARILIIALGFILLAGLAWNVVGETVVDIAL